MHAPWGTCHAIGVGELNATWEPIVSKRAHLTPAVVTVAIGIAPSVAEAQGRGTLQVSASVVSTDNAFRSLQAARAAISSIARPATHESADAVPTVARIALARDRHAVVVTIDYSRN
jgi:hypothetical protein